MIPMNTGPPDRVSVAVNPTFCVVYLASLSAIRFRGFKALIYLVFPLFALFFIVGPLCVGRGPAMDGLLLAALAFSATPLMIAKAGGPLGAPALPAFPRISFSCGGWWKQVVPLCRPLAELI